MLNNRNFAALTIVGLTVGVLILAAMNILFWIKNQEYTDTFREALRTENARLERIEFSLSALGKSVDGLLEKTALVSGAREGANVIEELTQLLRQLTTQANRDIPEFKVSSETVNRLNILIRRLEAMDQKGFPRLGLGTRMPMPVPPVNFVPPNVAGAAPDVRRMPERFSGLSNEKQAQVEQAFREHAEFIRREMSNQPDPSQTSPEQLREIMEVSQDFLIDKLSGILDADELDRFIRELQPQNQQ